MADKCPKCQRPYIYDDAPESDEELCFDKAVPQREHGDRDCIRIERDLLRSQLRVSEAEVARLTEELEDVRKLDAWALASMHKVVRIGRASGGRAAVLLVEVNKVEPFTGDKPEHARRAAVEYLEKESKDG